MQLKFLYFLLSVSLITLAQRNPLPSIIKKNEKLQNIDKQANIHPFRILYTQISRTKNGTPKFKTFELGHAATQYFYPASTVKLATVVAAFEKAKENQISIHWPMFTRGIPGVSDNVWADSTSENGFASLAHYAKKILLVSDNDAYNRLYEFVNKDELNQRLQNRGLLNTKILHRLSIPLSIEDNARTNLIYFIDNGQLKATKPEATAHAITWPYAPVFLGKGYMKNQELVSEPFDFTYKNKFPLEDQQKLLKAILFPSSVKPAERFDLSAEQLKLIQEYMYLLPTSSEYPNYKADTASYYDAYCKFIMFGGKKGKMPKHLKIYNKVGDAYGFMIDNAYVVDEENQVEFILSAEISCNSDGVFNDDHYDYETVGQVFFEELGKEIYEFEKKRKRKHKIKIGIEKMEEGI